MSNQSSSLIL